MRERESGRSVTDVMKFKSLTKRYYPKIEPKYEGADTKEQAMNEADSKKKVHIERGCIVESKGRACRFVVIGIGNKFYNKWFLLPKSQETPVWPAEKGKEKSYRFNLREIVQDKETGVACFKPYSELHDTRIERKNCRAYVAINNLNDVEKIN